MSSDQLPINWFDLVLVTVLIMGIFRGRKRGMSAELMTFLQWITIVVACSIFYKMLGEWLADVAMMGKLLAYVSAYLLIGIIVFLVFLLFKRMFNGKLVGSDAFGKAEYYLGMPAGMVRFGCVLMAGLALLNAPLYTQAEIKARRDYQMKNFDSEFFPGLYTLQANVFQKSLTGSLIKSQLGFLLIEPTIPAGGKQFKQQEWQGLSNL